MDTYVQITEAESYSVNQLFSRYNTYLNMLGYLAKYGSLDTDLFDKKWEEAVEINIKLEQLKNELDIKYHPNDNINYSEFYFDFINHRMVYKQ